jgi:hypothetical protein
MYRDHGGYISTGVREVWSKETDRCPLTHSLTPFQVIDMTLHHHPQSSMANRSMRSRRFWIAT